MVRLTHLSGSLQGTASLSPKAVIRIGRGAACDVRFDPQVDTRVSAYHAEIRFSNGHYVIVDVGSSNGTLLNGKMVREHRLRSGDKLRFGAQGGPEVRFDIDDSMAAVRAYSNGGMASQAAFPPAAPVPRLAQTPAAPPMAAPVAGPEKDASALAVEAQQKIALARAISGGESSGQTMFIMADTLKQVEATTERKTGKRWKKVVGWVLAVAFVGFAAMGVVIWQQKEQIEKITRKKESADKEIQKIQLQMQLETDPERLQGLEERLQALTGKAQAAIGEMEQKDRSRAAEMAEGGDELEREIRRILRKFDADTYVVPPIFKERLKFHIQQTMQRSNTRTVVYKRKKQYWPIIVKEFSALGLPEEMGYVAWVESQFDPYAQSAAHARGMWQFMDFRAREMGLRVDSKVDERTDVVKSTHAAARYLANLLAEFGSDSFMLAIASYNKGENGMRRVLHQIAQEPGGFRKEKRDFWHLYRLKKLPEETLEYVPQILAAAIISNNPQKYGLE
ncbi:MAG TPA: transglycosylase SLT domain-containing protein [Myxococcales bacterium]|nr:transglycosylase SLT domain-containing protein [Myxococcales bacterium]